MICDLSRYYNSALYAALDADGCQTDENEIITKSWNYPIKSW